MPTTYTYYDPYLTALITEARETRALADVNAVRSDFPAEWLERLTRLRAYIITCQESQRTADDLFSVKFSQYSREYDKTLPVAIAAADRDAAGSGTAQGMASIFSVELIRG